MPMGFPSHCGFVLQNGKSANIVFEGRIDEAIERRKNVIQAEFWLNPNVRRLFPTKKRSACARKGSQTELACSGRFGSPF